MKKRLLAVIGFPLLSIMVLAGCNNKVQNPPPPTDNNGVIHNNDGNGVNNNNGNGVNNNNGVGDGHNDINTNNDGNPAVVQNTTREDVIEDKVDMNDKNHKGQ